MVLLRICYYDEFINDNSSPSLHSFLIGPFFDSRHAKDKRVDLWFSFFYVLTGSQGKILYYKHHLEHPEWNQFRIFFWQIGPTGYRNRDLLIQRPH